MSTINLFVEPETPPVLWKDFVTNSPRFSVALDGYVYGRPQFDMRGPRANFNHHEEVARLETRATCAQVLIGLRQGFFRTFSDNGRKIANVFVNDCDEDVCVSVFLLRNSYMVTQAVNPLLNRLVFMEDCLDTTSGSYPFPEDLPSLEELAWVFEPYRLFRASGQLYAKKEHEYRSIIDDVGNRILLHITGKGKRLSLDTRFNVLKRSKDLHLVEELGAQSRVGMFSSGITSFLSFQQRPDGKWAYSAFRQSELIPVNLPRLYDKWNEAEGLTNNTDRWGGGPTTGGSPRISGSSLSPDKAFEIAEKEGCIWD